MCSLNTVFVSEGNNFIIAGFHVCFIEIIYSCVNVSPFLLLCHSQHSELLASSGAVRVIIVDSDPSSIVHIRVMIGTSFCICRLAVELGPI